jgi:hypothetical protein
MERRDLTRAIVGVAAGSALLPSKTEAQTCTTPCFPITQAEISASIPAAQINTSIPPYRADRYGFSNAPGATGASNAQSLANAVKAATAAGARLKIPGSVALTPGALSIYGVPYPYSTSTVLELTCDVEGDGELGTVISCSGGPGSNFFSYFRLTGEKEIRELWIQNGGAIADDTIGLQLSSSAANGGPTQPDAHMRVTRVLVSGFATNIQIERTFIVTFDQVRSTGGSYGIYCQPNVTAPDNASPPLVTTHLHLNCYYAENAVNVFYQTSTVSNNITFVNGASELATKPFGANGSSYANYFGGISNLHFIDWYCESQPAATVIAAGGGTVTFDGLYLNGTGGIYLGSNAIARFINVRTTSSSDILAGGDGSQIVTMEGCSWPAASTNFQHLVLMQTWINSVFTPFSSV